MILAAEKVAECRRLLAAPDHERLSQRRIGILCGISRGSVANIYHGRRPDYAARRPKPDPFQPSGPTEPCPGCGHRVEMPCRACLTRARLKQAGIKLRDLPGQKYLGLDLECQPGQESDGGRVLGAKQRQQAILARKRLAGEPPGFVRDADAQRHPDEPVFVV